MVRNLELYTAAVRAELLRNAVTRGIEHQINELVLKQENIAPAESRYVIFCMLITRRDRKD